MPEPLSSSLKWSWSSNSLTKLLKLRASSRDNDNSRKWRRLLQFQKRSILWQARVVIWFDFESSLNPIKSCMNNPQISSSRVSNKSRNSGYSLVAIEDDFWETFILSLVSFKKNCSKNFLRVFHLLARDVYFWERRGPNYFGDCSQHATKNLDLLDLPGNFLVKLQEKCLNHSHFLG